MVRLIILIILTFITLCDKLYSSQELEKVLSNIRPIIDNLYGETIPHDKLVDAINQMRGFLYRATTAEEKSFGYYYMGILYYRAKMYPEAFAYWKIVLEDYFNTKAALETIELISELDLEKKEVKTQLLRNFIQKTPENYLAHTLAWVFLAKEALLEGNIDDVKRQLEFIEQARPDLFMDVPQLFLLKGDLLQRLNDSSQAIENWLRYANLIDNRNKRVQVFFKIGKELMKSDLNEAKRYFLLVRSLNLDSPEGVATSFKIAKINLMQEMKLEELEKREKREPLDINRLKNRLDFMISKYPNHPLKNECFLDFIEVLTLSDRIYDSLKVTREFLHKNKTLNQEEKETLLRLIQKNIEIIKSRQIVLDVLIDINENLTRIYSDFLKDSKLPISQVVKDIIDLQVRAMEDARKSNPVLAMELLMNFYYELEDLKGDFPRDIIKAIIHDFCKDKYENDFVWLLNFYYENMDGYEFFLEPEFLFYVGLSWLKLDVPEEAQRFFYSAINKKLDPEILVKYGIASIKTDDQIVAKAIEETFERNFNANENHDFLWFKLLLSHKQKKWDTFSKISLSLLKNDNHKRFEPLFSFLYLDYLIETAKWDEVKLLYEKLEKELNPKDKLFILRKWGDISLLTGNIDSAIKVYEKLLLESNNEAKDKFRYMVALRLKSNRENILEEMKDLAPKDDFWTNTLIKIRQNEEKIRDIHIKNRI